MTLKKNTDNLPVLRRNTLPILSLAGRALRGPSLALALMGSTALVPAPAHAMPPVVAAAVAVVGSLTATFTALGTALGLSVAAAAAFGTFATQLVIGLALSALVRALAPRPSIPEPSARMVNYAQPLTYMETVYGTTRKGGPIAYTNFGNKRRDVVIILAAHEIDGYEQHWLDEWPVDLPPGTNTVATEPPGDLARIITRRGTLTQGTLPLVDKYDELTAAHNFAGLAVAQVTAIKPAAEDFSKNYPRGREWAYAPVIRGKNNIFDPRDQTYKWTDNAALIIADWATNIMGKGVNWDNVAIEADVADTPVPLKGGGTRAKWTLNGTISDDVDDEQIRAQLGTACDAYMYETPEGEVGFVLGRYYEPTITLTEDDFYSLTVSEGVAEQEAPNEIVIQYTEPANAWRETPSAAWVADPEARDTREDYSVFMINHHNQAIRVAKRLMRAKRAQYKGTGVLKYIGNKIMRERFVRITHDELGLDQVFEIEKLVRNEDGLSFNINLLSVTAEDFAFDPDAEEPAQPAYGDTVAIVDDDRPTNITATSVAVGGVPGVRVAWTPGAPVNAHRVRWAVKDSGNWEYSPILSAGVTQTEIAPLDDQVTYDFQVAAVSAVSGAQFSTYEPTAPVEATPVLNSTPPSNLAAFSTSLSGNTVTINFTSPNDPNYFATRIYRGGTNVFGDALVIQTEYGAPNAADSYDDTGLSAGDYYYWGVPINASGIEGNASGPSLQTVV